MVAPHIKRAMRKRLRAEAEAHRIAMARADLAEELRRNQMSERELLAEENIRQLPKPPKTKARKKTPAKKSGQTKKEGN